MITNVGANPNPIKVNYKNKVGIQENFTPKTVNKRDTSSDESVSLSNSTNEETDIKSLYESEQTSTFFRIANAEQERTINNQSELPRCYLTEDELSIIQNKINTSDDPRKYYEAAFDLLNKGVLNAEDLPKTFALVCDSGEVIITAGSLLEYDLETMEPPGYVENLIKTILDKLHKRLESSAAELDEE